MTISDGVMATLTLIIAIATVAYAIIAYRQAKYMRRQYRFMRRALTISDVNAKAAETAAIAARDSVDTLVATERAWFTVEVKGFVDSKEFSAFWKDPTTIPADLNGVEFGIEYAFVNGGKTVGRIIHGYVTTGTAIEQDLPVNPAEFAHFESKPTPEMLVVPGCPQPGISRVRMSRHQMNEFFNCRKALVAYWQVTYLDVTGETHEMRVCRICNNPEDPNATQVRFVFGGPPTWNHQS